VQISKVQEQNQERGAAADKVSISKQRTLSCSRRSAMSTRRIASIGMHRAGVCTQNRAAVPHGCVVVLKNFVDRSAVSGSSHQVPGMVANTIG
jgi:hypothetical protein